MTAVPAVETKDPIGRWAFGRAESTM